MDSLLMSIGSSSTGCASLSRILLKCHDRFTWVLFLRQFSSAFPITLYLRHLKNGALRSASSTAKAIALSHSTWKHGFLFVSVYRHISLYVLDFPKKNWHRSVYLSNYSHSTWLFLIVSENFFKKLSVYFQKFIAVISYFSPGFYAKYIFTEVWKWPGMQKLWPGNPAGNYFLPGLPCWFIFFTGVEAGGAVGRDVPWLQKWS